MAAVEFTIRNKRTGRLSFRRVYPEALRASIPGRPTELKRSLGGSSFALPHVAERYRAALAEYDAVLRGARGLPSDEQQGPPAWSPLEPPLQRSALGPSSPPRRRRGTNAATFNAIAQSILDNEALGIGPSTIQSSRTALAAFQRFVGTPEPEEIRRAQVAEFRDWLVKGEHDPARTTRLSGKTVSQYLGSLSALWNKGQREGHIPYESPNPFARHLVPMSARPDAPTELSLDELQAIFSLPLFTQGERPSGGKGGAAYWLPLMLLMTGARPEELAQLLIDDFHLDPASGRLMVKFTDLGEHPAKGHRNLKTSRTGWGRRTIPVPLMLIGLGLDRYLGHLRATEEKALFPALRPKGSRNLLFAGFGEWWSKYLKAAGAFPMGEGRRGAREFRHNWNTAARRAGVPLEAREYIMGHSASGQSCNASYGSRESLGWEMDRVVFDGLNLQRVMPWSGSQPAIEGPSVALSAGEIRASARSRT